MTDDFITAPTTGYADIVLASIPRDGNVVDDTLRTLSDPSNYTHVLDFRGFEDA